MVADTYPAFGLGGVHLQPVEAVAAALEGRGVLVIAEPDVARRVAEAAGGAGELWDNGSPIPATAGSAGRLRDSTRRPAGMLPRCTSGIVARPVTPSRSLSGRTRDRDDVLVLALPRGGVVVAFALAQELEVALDVYLVRKLGAPGREELALGAIASDGTRVLNHDVVAARRVTDDQVEAIAERESRELRAPRARLPRRARARSTSAGAR